MNWVSIYANKGRNSQYSQSSEVGDILKSQVFSQSHGIADASF